MKVIDLSVMSKTPDPYLDTLANELERLSEPGRKVYTTYCEYSVGRMNMLRTTSKDLHLHLGRLSWEGLSALSTLLERELLEGECGSLFLSMHGKNGLMASLAVNDENGLLFHLSPIY